MMTWYPEIKRWIIIIIWTPDGSPSTLCIPRARTLHSPTITSKSFARKASFYNWEPSPFVHSAFTTGTSSGYLLERDVLQHRKAIVRQRPPLDPDQKHRTVRVPQVESLGRGPG